MGDEFVREEPGLSDEEVTEIAEVIYDAAEYIDSHNNNEDDEEDDYAQILAECNAVHEDALFKYCYKHNIPYVCSIVNSLLKTKEDSVYNQLPDIYIDTIKADFRYQNLTFFEQLHRDNFDKIYSEEASLISFSEEDRKNRQVVIDVFSYDPFKNDKEEDRPQLYRDLAGMTNESMRKDIAKQKAALNIVRSYQNIEHYQQQVNELTSSGSVDSDTQETLDALLGTISKVQANINQTAEKNNFTVKGVGSNGRGMLSDVLNQVGIQVVDSAVVNYYDIETSKAIGEVADISWNSMLKQVNLTKTDYVEILTNQANMVREAHRIANESMEALRLAKEKIVKQELIDELAADYRKKGISEEEIEEFIAREYTVHDGKDS